MTERGIEHQVFGEGRVLHERRTQLRPLLSDRVTVINGDRGAAEARQLAAKLSGIGIEHLLLVAMLGTEVDGDAVIRGRQTQAVLAEFAGDFTVVGAHAVAARTRAREVQVVQLGLRHAAI